MHRDSRYFTLLSDDTLKNGAHGAYIIASCSAHIIQFLLYILFFVAGSNVFSSRGRLNKNIYYRVLSFLTLEYFRSSSRPPISY